MSLPRHHEPIVAIATAPGRGGVGVVRVSGQNLGSFIEAICGKALQPRVATYLPFKEADGRVIDQGLALHFVAPHSYTGEDVLELQAHGGPVVLQLLVARCLSAAAELLPNGHARLPGLRLAQPGEFTERAFLNDKLDLAQAEAIADLIDASTEAAARSASRSLAGEFSDEVARLREALIHLRMLVEATLDFPEEEIDFLQKADAAGQLQRLQAQLTAVQRKTRLGALLREGIQVVIAGQPNAGKSSLLNALAGAELAIVTPIAGTTRDFVQQTIQIDGVPLHVIDTAGLREDTEADEVERIGIARAWGQIEQADAVLFLHDLTRMAQPEYSAADAAIAAALQARLGAGVPVLDVLNKVDANAKGLPGSEDVAALVASGLGLTRGASATKETNASHDVLQISAKTGEGLQHLRQRLLDIAGWQSGGEGLYIARERHVQALNRVGEHLALAEVHLQVESLALDLLAEELRLAQNALNEITGAFGADDLLGVIFSSFCIGK